MKKLIAALLILSAFNAISQTPANPVTPSFRANTFVNKFDSLAYNYTGKIGGWGWFYNADYIRANFAKRNGGNILNGDQRLNSGSLFVGDGSGLSSLHLGNDLRFADINIPNTTGVIGIQDTAKAFLKFGNSPLSLGYDGTNYVIGTNAIATVDTLAGYGKLVGGNTWTDPNIFGALQANSFQTGTSLKWIDPPIKTSVVGYSSATDGSYNSNNQNVFVMQARNLVGTWDQALNTVPTDSVFNALNTYNGITRQTLSNKAAIYFDGYGASLTTSSQSQAMGFVKTLADGRVVNIFQLNPSTIGTSSTAAYIALRISTDNGKTWGATSVVYTPTSAVLLNPDGGIADDGTISIWFSEQDRQIDPTVRVYKHIYSTDNVNYTTWSTPIAETPTYTTLATTYGPIIKDINGKYIKLIENTRWAEVWESTDCKTWTKRGFAWDYTSSLTYNADETGWDYDPVNNKWLALSRRQLDYGGYVQHTSNDGITWTPVGLTNHATSADFLPSPFVVYDRTRHVWITSASYRPESPVQNGGVRIFCDTANILTNPLAYTLKKEYIRPIPSNVDFFGYQTMTKLANGEWLCVFSDQYEPADRIIQQVAFKSSYLYQFNIKFINNYSGQNIASNYPVSGYAYNVYDGKYEPTPSAIATRRPNGSGNDVAFYGTNIYMQQLRAQNIFQSSLGQTVHNITAKTNSTSQFAALELRTTGLTTASTDSTSSNNRLLALVSFQGTHANTVPGSATAVQLRAEVDGTPTVGVSQIPGKLFTKTGNGTSSPVNAIVTNAAQRTGFGSGVTTANAWVDILANTATNEAFIIRNSAVDVTSPNNGSIWNNGGVFKYYNGSATRRFVGANNVVPATTDMLVGNGTDWTVTAATGTGAPVRATSPTIAAPKLTGSPVLTNIPTGTAGTDSLLVKHPTTNVVSKIAANSYAPTTQVNASSAQTTVAGSTSGSIIASMPFQGTTYKKVLIRLNALNGTALYTFPTAFSTIPSIFLPAGVTVSETLVEGYVVLTTSGATTCNVIIEGY